MPGRGTAGRPEAIVDPEGSSDAIPIVPGPNERPAPGVKHDAKELNKYLTFTGASTYPAETLEAPQDAPGTLTIRLFSDAPPSRAGCDGPLAAITPNQTSG